MMFLEGACLKSVHGHLSWEMSAVSRRCSSRRRTSSAPVSSAFLSSRRPRRWLYSD